MANKVVKRAYKYRFYPTPDQAAELNRTFGCVRYVYNRALEIRTRAWTQDQQRITYSDTSRMLTEWKKEAETEWLKDPSSVPLQTTLRHLQAAFDSFWRKQTKYPKFKKRGKSKDSATYFRRSLRYRNGTITLPKMSEPLNIVWSRPLPDGVEPSQATVSRDPSGRYHISLLTEETIAPHKAVNSTVGVDLGITSLATLSTGEKMTNPYHEKRDRQKLAKAHRNLDRKQKGSQNRAKAKLKVARIYARIKDRRRDHLHKVTTRIIRENQTVVIEDLGTRQLLKNHKLARAISDASWFEFRTMLEYKADWYGRSVIAIDRFYPSSKTCSNCGSIAESMPLKVREWTCKGCGSAHDRDINAAKNIRAAGLAVQACGDGVRPPRLMGGEASVDEAGTLAREL